MCESGERKHSWVQANGHHTHLPRRDQAGGFEAFAAQAAEQQPQLGALRLSIQLPRFEDILHNGQPHK